MENKQFEELEDDDLSTVSGGAGQLGFLLNMLTESNMVQKNLGPVNRVAEKFGVEFKPGEDGHIILSLNGRESNLAEVTDYLRNLKA